MFHLISKSKSLIALLLLTTSCATLKPEVAVSKFGVVDPLADKNIVDQVKQLNDEAKDVLVISGIMPEGLMLEVQSSKLVILDGYQDKYDIIGSTSADYIKAASKFRDLLWTYEHKDWRKWLCYPQAPLKLVTMGFWGLLPIQWPCTMLTPSEEHLRKAGLIEEMKKATKVSGGNLLIVTESGGDCLTSSHIIPMTRLTGLMINKK